MVKRGQVTLFIAIGIMIILTLGMITYVSKIRESEPEEPGINIDEKKQSIAAYIDACFEDKVKEARNKYGFDEAMMESHINDNMCRDFSKFEEQNMRITFKEARTDVTISEGKILAEMKYSVTINMGLESQALEDFSFDMAVTTRATLPTEDGSVTEDRVLKSGDGLLELFIARGTIITDEDGNPVDNPEILIRLIQVDPNPTTYGTGIYEINPHLFFSQPVILRLRYYNLNLGNEENLRIIKRPGFGYIWMVVPDQDPPYTENNMVIARISDFSQIALTATCGKESGAGSIYFDTSYVYIQNCEPCKCFEKEEGGKLKLDQALSDCADDKKKSPNEELTEEEEYTEARLFSFRGGTIDYYNNQGCREPNEGEYYYYINEPEAGGTGVLKLNFEFEKDGCIDAITKLKEDVDDKIFSVKVDGKEEKNVNDALKYITKKIKDVKEGETIKKEIEITVKNDKDACSHARFLLKVAGSQLKCPDGDDISPAKCCTETNKKDCDWTGTGDGETPPPITPEGCNKLGFHTLVQDTGDQNLIDKHLEVVKEFSGSGGWALNLDYLKSGGYDSQAYVSKANSLGLKPILRIEYPLGGKPSDAQINTMAKHVNEMSGLKYVQFLNEPNLPETGITPQEYANLLKTFNSKVNSNIQIIAGNLAPNQGHATADTLNYIYGMFSVSGVADAFDIWGSHSYPGGPWTKPVDEGCKDKSCAKIDSIQGYMLEIAKIKEKIPGFNKPVIITETGYKISAGEDFIAENMKKAFKIWEEDPVVIGVTPFILAPIGDEWKEHLWVTIPVDNPNNVQKTSFFEAVRSMDHSSAKCMQYNGSTNPPPAGNEKSTTVNCFTPNLPGAKLTLSYSGKRFTIKAEITTNEKCSGGQQISHVYCALQGANGEKLDGYEWYCDTQSGNGDGVLQIGDIVSITGELPGPGGYKAAIWIVNGDQCDWPISKQCTTSNPLYYTGT